MYETTLRMSEEKNSRTLEGEEEGLKESRGEGEEREERASRKRKVCINLPIYFNSV